ncbi:MAG TPA: response regulator [Rhodocyclaceae bacterium]|nr:response regulator [Rhodocyclaceae bacterium]
MLNATDDPTVLLVEPSGVQAKVVSKAFADLGMHRIRVVGSANAALAAMTEIRPDVVVSALYLPDMSGTDLVLAMREDDAFAGLPFILVSSETRPQALDSVRQAGVCGILPKPFTNKQLRRVLDTTLDFLSIEHDTHIDMRAEDLRILLVDDSGSARKFMRRLLENLGVREFYEADNGRNAIAVLENTMVDLVVTDYNMPEMDGQALVKFIREQSWQSTVPILMVTSESDQGRLAAVEAAGVSGICDKPFEASVVRDVIARLLADRA